MPLIEYVGKKFSAGSLEIINFANEIIAEYDSEGIGLTLRQLYYQFVSRDRMRNVQSEYKRLGGIISDARLAGLIDWYAIEDRTRGLKGYYHNTDPGDAVNDALRHFKLDKWEGQEFRPEVWIEKEALTGVIDRVCRELDVPYFACKGYVSQSEMWVASQRLERYREDDQIPIIIHLGDHDPSGMDMTRDIFDRNSLFVGGVEVTRIALNYDQIEQYEPPPNPTKMTDSRAESYISEFGQSSWELDALEPRVIRSLIEDTVALYTDDEVLLETKTKEEKYREILENVVENWETI